MSVDTLRHESGIWLNAIHKQFTAAMGGRMVTYPLADTAACQAFANCVTATLTQFRNVDSRLPPTALILTMIDVCEDQIASVGPHIIPRAFAYEMLDRLNAEIPATMDFALDQVGRIITEAGTRTDGARVRRAFIAQQQRMTGAFAALDLSAMVADIWRRRFPDTSSFALAA
jgi:hypothetical protein